MIKEQIREMADRIEWLGGMTVNERLYATGLMDTFDNALKNDKALARTILEGLKVDELSITRILGANPLP